MATWAAAAPYIGMGVNALGGLLSGKPEKQLPGNLHLVNAQQQALYNQMYAGLMNGSGDFGYGSNIKQGTSQLQNMMAQRGIKVGSGGAYSGAYGNMVGGALGADANARREYAMNLLRSPLQTETITGRNLVPGSPSFDGKKRGFFEKMGDRFFAAHNAMPPDRRGFLGGY